MICPNCNEEMEKGVIVVYDTFYTRWFSKDIFMKKTCLPISKKSTEKAGGIVLPVDQSCMISHINAYNCKKCRKIIIDY